MELAVDLQGKVVSACVLRSVREDFDNAAQAATWQWRFKIPKLTGSEPGFVLTVVICTPDRRCHQQTAQESGNSVLPDRLLRFIEF